MSNIIIEWLDFTWKTPITEKISDILSFKLINKDLVSNIINDYDNIKNWKSTLDNFNSIDNAVFDRHFMSLLVYWSLTNPTFYETNIDEEKVFSDFIKTNKNSVLIFRYSSFNRTMNKIFNRLDFKEHKLSKHDMSLMIKDYFHKYSNAFHALYEKFYEYNEKTWNKIHLLKEKESENPINKTIYNILTLSWKQSTFNSNKSFNKINDEKLIIEEKNLIIQSKSDRNFLYSAFRKTLEHVELSNLEYLEKSQFVNINKYFSIKFFQEWTIVNYWKSIYEAFLNYIDWNNNYDNNLKEKFKKSIIPLSMTSKEYQEFKSKQILDNKYQDNLKDIELKKAFKSWNFDLIDELLK